MVDVGKRALVNSQTALQTVAHNVANKETEGFSRQRVEIKSNLATGSGNVRIGMGSKTGAVTRINNSYIEKQIEQEGSKFGYSDSRAESLGRVEQVFNEQTNKGLNQFVTEFFNSFRELSNNPESLASRTLVKETGDFLTKDFGRVHRNLTDIQKDLDFQIVNSVAEINDMSREIAELNRQIQHVEITGAKANDERDRRDLLIKNLSEKIEIRYAENDEGQVTITAGKSAVLVSGLSARELKAVESPETATKRESNVDIFYIPGEKNTPVNITNHIKGGRVGGLLDVRDNVINEHIREIDQMAYTLQENVNRIHTRGFDNYNQAGQAFFEPLAGPKDAAQKLSLNRNILGDVGLIAAAAAPGSPGDNRIANVISALQYQKVMDDKSATVDDYYASVVGRIGVESSRANTARDTLNDSLGQLKNIRESISGVSLDEETTKMIEFQKSFDASARLIRTADEMLETVLNLKRL